MADDLIINSRVTIPASELVYTTSRSSGPGGQHVNTADTRVQLRWSLRETVALTEAQRSRARIALAARLTEAGEILLASDKHRSQRRNREEVTERLARAVAEALVRPKPRRKSKPSRAAKEKRLQEKRRKSQTKKDRGKKYDGGD